MTPGQGAISVGDLTNVQGVAIGHGARAIALRFSLVEQVILQAQGGEARLDPTFDLERRPLALPEPHQREPEVGHLIGRSAELQALLALLQQTCLGTRGHVVWLTGRPGMGRNALAQRFLHLARTATLSGAHGSQPIDLQILTARFRPDDSERTPDERGGERGDDHWSRLITAVFPTASAAGGPVWVSLMRQILIASGSSDVPPGLADDVHSLAAWLRRILAGRKVGLLVLRGIEQAPVVWVDLLDELGRDATDDVRLMVLPILTLEEPLRPGTPQPYEALALKQCAAGRATAIWLDTLAYAELEQSLPNTDPRVLERLYALANGSPLWIEKLWEDWHRRGWLQRSPNQGWRASDRFAGSSARAHALAVLRAALRSSPKDSTYSVEDALRILTVAALEGHTFTVAAVAAVTGDAIEDLTGFLAGQLSGPRGLLAAAPPATVRVGGQQLKVLERFRFDPPITYHVLAQLPEAAERSRLAQRLADALERAYWPCPEQVGARLRDLLALGGTSRPAQTLSDTEQRARQRRMAFAATVPVIDHRVSVLEQAVSFWTHTSAEDPARGERLALAHEELARAFHVIGRNAEAFNHAETALELYRVHGWHSRANAAALLSASLAQRLGQWSLARERVEDALPEPGDPVDRRDEAHALHLLGEIARHDNDPAQAERHKRQALEHYTTLQDAGGQASCHISLGWIWLERRNIKAGAAAFQQALRAAEAAADSPLVVGSLQGLGHSARLLRDLPAAREHLERALELVQQSEALAVTAWCFFELSQVERAAQAPDRARDLALRAAALYERAQDHCLAGDCLSTLAKDEPGAGWDARAQACYRQDLAIARLRTDRVQEARALGRLADMAERAEAIDEAITHRQALIAIGPAGLTQETNLAALERLARRLGSRGRAREARELINTIVAAYDRLAQPARAVGALLAYVKNARSAEPREPAHRAFLSQALARAEHLSGEDVLYYRSLSALALADLEADVADWPAVLALAQAAQTDLEAQGDLDLFRVDYGRALRLRAIAAWHLDTDPLAYEQLLALTEEQLPNGVDLLFVCPNVETLFDIDVALGRRQAGCRLLQRIAAAARAMTPSAPLTDGIQQRLRSGCSDDVL